MGKGTDLTPNERERFGASTRRPEEIEADIEQTLEGLEGTMDEIKEKFSSEHIKGQVRDATVGRAKRLIRTTGEKAKHLGENVMEGAKANAVTRTITNNPIPAALVGIGLGWLIVKGLTRSNGRWETSGEFESDEMLQEESDEMLQGASEESEEMLRGAGERAGERFEHIKGTAAETLSKAREKATRAKEKAGEMMFQAKEKAGQLRTEARSKAQALKERYDHSLQDRPLLLLGAAFAIGFLVGLSIPETRRERELMGETKDRLLRKAKEMARGNMEKMEHVAAEAKRSAMEKAKEEGLLS